MSIGGVPRARAAFKRIRWGTQEVGLARTIVGLGRLAAISMQRASKMEVKTATSGFKIAFKNPTQRMPLLIIFQDLLDPELALLPQLLRRGSIAIDVGASIGTWTLWAAKTGAIVHACEPDDDNFSMLKENILRNGLQSNVITHHCALGHGDGWTSAHSQPGGFSTHFGLSTSRNELGRMPVHSLDYFVEHLGIERVDVLKVNTAGCEADVLAGSQDLFRRERVGVAMFLDGVEVRAKLNELRRFSYQLGFYDSRKGQFIYADSSEKLDNLRPSPINRYALAKHTSVRLIANSG